jgi:hypothetical protein
VASASPSSPRIHDSHQPNRARICVALLLGIPSATHMEPALPSLAMVSQLAGLFLQRGQAGAARYLGSYLYQGQRGSSCCPLPAVWRLAGSISRERSQSRQQAHAAAPCPRQAAQVGLLPAIQVNKTAVPRLMSTCVNLTWNLMNRNLRL